MFGIFVRRTKLRSSCLTRNITSGRSIGWKDDDEIRILLRVLSNGFASAPKAFLLSTKRSNYLFNPGEGTHRLLRFDEVKRTEHVFITRKAWNCAAGLYEILKESKDSMTVHCPFSLSASSQDMDQISLFSKKFLRHGKKQHDYDKVKVFSDEFLSVKVVEFYRHKPNLKFYSYIINLKQSVKENVYSTTAPDLNLLVVDLPNEKYIEPALRSYAKLDHLCISVIVHLSDTNVLNDKRYQEWIVSKGLNVRHLVLDEGLENKESNEIFLSQKTLNLVDRQIFPEFPTLVEHKVVNKIQQENVLYGLSRDIFTLTPNLAFYQTDSTAANHFKFTRSLKYFSNEPNIEEILYSFRANMKSIRKRQLKLNPYPFVTFLGTGSSKPSPIRNSSAILVSLNENTNILLDCGEGTLAQMKRSFGAEGFRSEMLKLKAVFISHRHSDHNFGLFSIVKERKRVFLESNRTPHESKMHLCIPDNIQKYLITAVDFEKDVFSDCDIISNEDLSFQRVGDYSRRYFQLIDSLKIKSLQTVPVTHVAMSTALIFETFESENSPSFKLVFSGDCRPTELLATCGKNCDLLIHEATFDNSLQRAATMTKHSTIGEAIEIGTKMNAKSVILWHFSKRYNKIPLIDDIINSGRSNVSISFDNMRVSRNDLELLPKFNQMYQTLFCKYDEKHKQQAMMNYNLSTIDELSDDEN